MQLPREKLEGGKMQVGDLVVRNPTQWGGGLDDIGIILLIKILDTCYPALYITNIT